MNPTVNVPNSSRGFSLVELTIAITFFGILMLGWLYAYREGILAWK